MYNNCKKWGMIMATAEYWNAKICINGHISDYGNGENDKYCNRCGTEVIDSCTNCGNSIRGASKRISMVFDGLVSYQKAKAEDMIFPNYCPFCGKPYKWTQLIIDNSVQLLALEDDIDPGYKGIIKNAIPDLLVNTPTTPISITKFREIIGTLSQPIKDAFYQLLIDVISETAKKALFP